MHKLTGIFIDALKSGLERGSISCCSKWAETYRVMGKPFPGRWTFKYHPWAREMCDAEAETVAIQKGAQLACTEVAINKTFYNIDYKGNSVLYILPASTPDASDFSTSRFDPALEMSSHLARLFSDTKNIGHKRAGNANLYIRGSRSRSQLKSLPAAFLVLDEVDEMVQENIVLVLERLSGQIEKQMMALSTPTIDHHGINSFFRQSTQEYYFFKCPSCSRFTNLVYPDCLVITSDDPNSTDILNSHIICKECKAVLPHEEKHIFLAEKAGARFVPTYSDRIIRGFHISQLYSSTIKPSDLAIAALRSQTNPADEQEFFNSKLGLTHTVEGARVTDEDLDKCTKNFKMVDESPPYALVTMGVDQGKWNHFEITQWFRCDNDGNDVNLVAKSKILKVGKVRDFEDLDRLMTQYKVLFCCIDAHPERRKAKEFAERFWGRVKLVFYGNNVAGKTINVHEEAEHTVTVDRTTWLDLSLGRFKRAAIDLPMDLPNEYKVHAKALVRIYKKRETDGEMVAKYLTGGLNEADHYAHAHNYNELALTFAVSLAEGIPITESVI